MQGSPPIVAVTGPDHGGWPAWVCLRWVLARMGLRACRVTPRQASPSAGFHALVLGGGADIVDAHAASEGADSESDEDDGSPYRHWGETLMSGLVALPLAALRWAGAQASPGRPDPRRDVLEFELLRRAEKAGVPVLGICRGAQLINIARGGTLLFDVQSMFAERPRLRTIFPRRHVSVEPLSNLGRFLDARDIVVNSLHHHAAGRVPDSLRIVAREESGVVQAIEDPFAPFFLGVQWHPEYLPQMPTQRRLFAAFADETRRSFESGRRFHGPRFMWPSDARAPANSADGRSAWTGT